VPPGSPLYALTADEDALYALDHFGLKVFDPATGARVFSYGVFNPFFITPAPAAAGPPGLLVVDGEGGIFAFRRGERPAPEGEVEVSGEIRVSEPALLRPGPIPVRVGDQVVETDSAGRFSARVRGRGELSAVVVSPDSLLAKGAGRASGFDTRRVGFDSRGGSARLVLELEARYPREDDAYYWRR
jgi:hypothetical protein